LFPYPLTFHLSTINYELSPINYQLRAMSRRASAQPATEINDD
jgi:hypothetical protein